MIYQILLRSSIVLLIIFLYFFSLSSVYEIIICKYETAIVSTVFCL